MSSSQRVNNTLVACRFCGRVHELEPLAPGMAAKCSRCGSRIAKRTFASLHLTAAFTLAALILYIPANTFPIMRFERFNAASENTVWQGSVRLYKDGDHVVGIIVFLASILIPALKLLGLLMLVISVKFNFQKGRLLRTWIFRVIDVVGRWAMLDVFVLAILVSLVKLQGLATVVPGAGLFAFAAVVVLTMFASSSFDPQLIWPEMEEESD